MPASLRRGAHTLFGPASPDEAAALPLGQPTMLLAGSPKALRQQMASLAQPLPDLRLQLALLRLPATYRVLAVVFSGKQVLPRPWLYIAQLMASCLFWPKMAGPHLGASFPALLRRGQAQPHQQVLLLAQSADGSLHGLHPSSLTVGELAPLAAGFRQLMPYQEGQA